MNNGEQFFNTSGGGYEIERSLRFNSADSAYLNRTPSVAGNRKTWTWAGWVKKVKPGQSIYLKFVQGGSPYPYEIIYFDNTDKLAHIYDIQSSTYSRRTLGVFRDPSAWYHIVFAADTTQATASNRLKIYVNGLQQDTESLFTGDMPLNLEGNFNSTTPAYINGQAIGNFYLADNHFIDGQALDPSSFGEFDTNGVWQPIEYTGSYGTNGFHLDFADNSSAAALGYDAAGSNDWTVNNIQATAPTYTYSSGWTANLLPGFPGTNCFNGTGTSLTIGGSSVASVWTAPTSLAFTELRVRGGHDGAEIFINGVNVTPQFTSSVGWVTVTGVSSPLSTITLDNTSGAGNARISAVVVDGDMLVDGRPFKARDIDSLVDSPTNGSQTDTGVGGEVVGNYATLNPLKTSAALSNGNLEALTEATGNGLHVSTIGMQSGKYYWEVTPGTPNNYPSIGIVDGQKLSGAGSYVGSGSNDWGYWGHNGSFVTNGSPLTTGSTYATGDIIGVAFDADTGSLYFYKNGIAENSGSPITTLANNGPYFAASSDINTATQDALIYNFGQRPFAYTAPSGFKALCTANLPEPTIADGSTAMDVVLYTGNGTTQTISGLNFSPDFVWIKRRSAVSNHSLFDTIRGATKRLETDSADAEKTIAQALTAFNSDGFSVGTDGDVNGNTFPIVAWTWDAGSSTVTNNDGSITSQVRANASAGFSVVTYTGAANTPSSIGHGLNVVPQFVIVKPRTTSDVWVCYHSAFNDLSKYIVLSSTNAVGTAAANYWGTSADWTSSTFGVYPLGGANNNLVGVPTVAYCFAPVAGYSSFGSYVGNNSTDGPMIYTGFRPKWLLIKSSSYGGSSWNMFDTARSQYNASTEILYANYSFAEATSLSRVSDILSNGFKLRGTDTDVNASGDTYIYAAFAEHPFATSRAR